MSVNYYDKTTGRVTTVAGGQRIWLGSKAAHDAEALADKLPFNCLMAVIETGLYFRDRNGVETLITSGNGGSSDIQVITMPTANSENEGKVVQYIGVTTAGYTHGYFYECISDRGDPAVYSWVWLDVGGGTDTPVQYDIMPVPAADFLNNIIQYVGDTNEYYTNAYFYKCVSDGQDPAAYSWEQVNVQEGGGQTIQVTALPAASAAELARVYQYIGATTDDYTHGYFYECTFDGTNYSWTYLDVDSGNSGQIQYTDIPAADAEHEGMIIQYLGDTNVNYHNGYFYKCVYDGDTYYWEQIDVQGQSSGQTIQVTSLDTPTAALLGKVYQYIGDTTADYKHGYFYECILDGAEYKWVNINVQDSPDDIGLSVVNGKLCITYDNT